MIRAATHTDIPAIVQLGQLLQSTSSYSGLGYSAEKVAKQCEALIDGAGVIFVSVTGDKIVGFIGGGVTEYWFSDVKVAFDYS